MKLAGLLILAASCSCAIAQQTTGETDIYYDSGRNLIYAVGSTVADYNTQYWYVPWTYSTMFNGGSYVGYDSEPVSTYLETPATPGYEVVVYTTHTINTEYETYEVDPYCPYCYDWYDAFGYDLLDDGGDPYSGGGWTLWVWTPPVIVTRVIGPIVSDQQSGARLRAPGPPATFDVRLRSFIPPLYVYGPDPYCSPYLYKKVIYNGNDRGFDPWSVSYKGHQSVTLVPSGPLALIPDNETGFTERYADDAIYGNMLLKDPILHDCYEFDDSAHASSASMYQTYGQPGQGQVSVEMSGSITNPLTPPSLTPPIDWNLFILVNDSNPSAPTYTISGQHDCFPAWEAYIGNQLIYPFTPTGYDLTTLSLCLSGVLSPVVVNRSGQIQ